jgi:hypothetical protein
LAPRTRISAATGDGTLERERQAMSTTREAIGEYDVVTLVNRVGRWPAGTEGTVVLVYPSYMVVEIDGIENSGDDMLEYLPDVAPENLRLVWKRPPSVD